MSEQPRKVIHLPRVRMLSRGGIRITNIKSIRPPDPEIVKKQEEDNLRAQLQKEIVSRSQACAYKKYECTLPVVGGRQYCARHILHDPSAPYTRCAHERCRQPAPLPDQADHQLCFEHARAAMYARQRSTAPPPPVVTTETLLCQLQHYVRPERTRTTSCASSVSVVSDPADQEITPHAVDPFKQIDSTQVNTSHSASIMECFSASDSDGDSVTLGEGGTARPGGELSDEEAPCEQQPLWRAGVFTAEEAVSEARTALVSLQSAYVRQMGRLRQLLQTARLQYVRALKAEREQYCSINAQSLNGPLTVRERRQLRKLKAYAGHRRKHGVDAVLARKLHHKRAKVNAGGGAGAGAARALAPGARCVWAEGGVRCAAAALPAARHCLKHVTCDPHQVLFVGCGDMRGGVPCREPAPRLPLASPACRYHTDPPAYGVFTLKKDDSDSDTDSHLSSVSQHTAADHVEEALPSEMVQESQFG